MSYEVSYLGDNTKRRAICDMFRYVGLTRSKIMLREARRIAKIEDDVLRNRNYNGLCMQIEFLCGVAGEPIRRLFAYAGGEEQLEMWIHSDNDGKPKEKAA